MLEFYPIIRLAHISVVLVSGGLFAFRGVFVAADASWPVTPLPRYLSYAIDALLVVTAGVLLRMLPLSTYSNGWLGMKLGLLVLYFVPGSFALKRARTLAIRRVCYALTLVLFLVMLSVAHTHDPMGPWLILRSWIGSLCCVCGAE